MKNGIVKAVSLAVVSVARAFDVVIRILADVDLVHSEHEFIIIRLS